MSEPPPVTGIAANRVPGAVDLQTGTVIVDLDCRRCGYNLRTLPEAGRCPECGSPVGLSTKGNFLRFANPEWVAKVAKGLKIIFAIIIANIVIGFINGSVMQPTTLYSFMLVFAVGCIDYYGVWLMTEPDPSGIGEEKNVTARKVVRVSLGIALLALVFQPMSEFFSGSDSFIVNGLVAFVGIVAFLASIVGWYAKFVFFAAIARRIPDDVLAKRAIFLRNGIIVCVAILVVFGVIVALTTSSQQGGGGGFGILFVFILPAAIAFLVFAILTIIFTYRLMKSVESEAESARYNWAVATEHSQTGL